MPMQNKPIYENSSKSDNGKVVKYTGKIFWEKISQGGEFGGRISKKNENLQITIQKWIYVLSFMQIGQWESVQI